MLPHEAGLLAAESEVLEVGDVQVLISTRYDRRYDGTVWHRVHQEDMCQALSVHPSLKYQSDGGPAVGDIADLLNRLPIEDRNVNAERFFKALAYQPSHRRNGRPREELLTHPHRITCPGVAVV